MIDRTEVIAGLVWIVYKESVKWKNVVGKP